ncbi:MAG: hypothetical protein QXY49_00955 [Thermofilaceae archaeon]
MKLLTPQVFEALKSALTIEVLTDLGELAKTASILDQHFDRLKLLGLLEARPLTVNFQCSEREVRIGCGDGVMSDSEIEAMREYGEIVCRTKEEVLASDLELIFVKGLSFVEEEKVGDLPRGVLPVSTLIELSYLPRSNTVIFPYKFTRLRLDEHRELHFVLTKSFLKKKLRAVHPVYGTVYVGNIAGVEVNIKELVHSGYPQLGVVVSRSKLGNKLSIMRVLGDDDLRELLSSLGD